MKKKINQLIHPLINIYFQVIRERKEARKQLSKNNDISEDSDLGNSLLIILRIQKLILLILEFSYKLKALFYTLIKTNNKKKIKLYSTHILHS